MKYINQKLHPHMPYVTRCEPDNPEHEKGKTTTVASSGCGLCAAIMVADRLLPFYDFDLDDAIALSYEVKANHGRGTDYLRFAPAFAEKLGLKVVFSKNVEDVSNCLRTGGAAVALVAAYAEGQGLFTRSGHYIAIIGEEPDGRFAILDPSFTDTKYEEPDRKGKVEIKNDVIVLCDKATLVKEEITTRPYPYFLFWRQ